MIAACGDGTVGSVAGHLAGADPLGILPLGTGNDFARSLDIPLNPGRAARLLGTGEVSRVDLGRLTRPGRPTTHFAHAATVGLNVDFAKLATRTSVRGRLGRLTYLAAAVHAPRERTTLVCSLQHDGVAGKPHLLQLSVISAPVIGGALGLTVRNPHARMSISSTCWPSRTCRLRRCFLRGCSCCWASTGRSLAFRHCKSNDSKSTAPARWSCRWTAELDRKRPGSSKRSPPRCEWSCPGGPNELAPPPARKRRGQSQISLWPVGPAAGQPAAGGDDLDLVRDPADARQPADRRRTRRRSRPGA